MTKYQSWSIFSIVWLYMFEADNGIIWESKYPTCTKFPGLKSLLGCEVNTDSEN